MSEMKPEAPVDALPAWVQVVGGLWCLLVVVVFVRQILASLAGG